jgi:hypothetical protein
MVTNTDQSGLPAGLRRQLTAAGSGAVVMADRSGRFRMTAARAGERFVVLRDETVAGDPVGAWQQFTLAEGEVVKLEVRR